MRKRLWYALAVTAVLASALPTAAARASAGYSFKAIASLGDPAPGGGFYTSDFEPSAVNSRGQVAFTADLAPTKGGDDIGEGVFVGSPGQLSNPARVGQTAPVTGTFSIGELGRIGLNEAGDASFAFSLKPFTTTFGLNSGAYRVAHNSGAVSAVMVPGQTAPGGGTFQGSFVNTGINDRGDMVFQGVVISAGVYLARQDGSLVSVAKPGDPVPGGGVFDSAINGSINDAGAIAFGGHVKGEECIQLGPFACGESVYLKSAPSGAIQSIAHQGTPSPCAAKPYRLAFGPVLNRYDAIAFIGDLTPPPGVDAVTGVFLYSNGTVSRVACPDDPMPGGGLMVSAGLQDETYWMNDPGQVSFAAVLNTDSNNGIADTGVYVSSHGSTTLVARTGTVIPGIGTIASVGLTSPGPPAPPNVTAGGEISNRGQVLFSATLTDSRVVLLLATPAT